MSKAGSTLRYSYYPSPVQRTAPSVTMLPLPFLQGNRGKRTIQYLTLSTLVPSAYLQYNEDESVEPAWTE
jgi:hypothetical protein